MARKRALVVDDSKSARVILSRMLEKYDIEVDMAESAEQAIEYLKSNRPDAIFMDHLMPGMDGLQAVQAIKGNPQTAMIPIMMYTSQEGELYVGQARALGAMGVLPKQVRPVDVSKVLYELHLLPDRRDMAEPALAPVELEAGAPVERAAAAALPRPPPASIGDAASNRRSRIRRSTCAASSSRVSTVSPRASSAMCATPCRSDAGIPAAPPARAAASGLALGRRDRGGAPHRGLVRRGLAASRATIWRNRGPKLPALTSANAELQRARAGSDGDGQGSHAPRWRLHRAGTAASAGASGTAARRLRRGSNRFRTARSHSIAAVSTCCAIC